MPLVLAMKGRDRRVAMMGADLGCHLKGERRWVNGDGSKVAASGRLVSRPGPGYEEEEAR